MLWVCFSIFEARLQEIFKDAKYAFDQAEKVLKEKDEFALYEKFHDLRQAINVLKHGDGKSYNILLQKEQQLPFRIKKRDESFFCEGDISEVTSLIKVDDEFVKFWDEEKIKAFDTLCEEENLNKEEVKRVVDTYLYDERPPLSDDIANTLNVKPKLLERKKVVPRVLEKIIGFVDRFYNL